MALRTSPKPRKAPVAPPGQKYCTRCDRPRPTRAFYPHKNTRDGLDVWCKPCRLDYQGKVEPPPPMTCAELAETHRLSASEKMLVYRLAKELRKSRKEAVERRAQGKRKEVSRKGRPRKGSDPLELSECDKILYGAGVTHPRRQYHLMTCAVAAANEIGIIQEESA